MNITEKDLHNYRPIPFYFITTTDKNELTYEKFYESLSDMKQKGFGGVIPFNRPPHGFTQEQYFSEFWFETIGNILRACRDLGLRVWLQDDFVAPSGNIGGKLKEWAPHLVPYKLVLKDGKVEVEEVPWGFPAFENPESALLFQKYVYEEYKKRFGEYFGTTIIGMFSDADSRRVNSEVYSTNSPMKDYFPWTQTFAQTFKQDYGYDITPYLESIIKREPSKQAHDYWEHNGKLYHGWFASNYEWCKKNGLEYTFHTSDCAPARIETSYFNSAFAEGKAIDAGIHSDYPGTDHECLDLNGGRIFLKDKRQFRSFTFGEENPKERVDNFLDVYADIRAKMAQSSYYLNDKKGCFCEMFAASNWDAPYKELRNIASWQIMQGITFIVIHAYHYKLHGVSKGFAPPSFCTKSHLDFDLKSFNDSLATDAFLASRGKLKVDFAILDPTDHIWQGIDDAWCELDLAKKLNHFPQGYVISDFKGLEKKAGQLKAVINPGLTLSEDERSKIKALGLDILEAEDITTPDEIEKKYPTGIKWQGDGDVMFMRRVLDDKKELLMVANIESDNTLTGTLTFDGKNYEVELANGEIAYFGNEFESYRSPAKCTKKLYLPKEYDVLFEKKNILNLRRWEDENSRAFCLLTPECKEDYMVKLGWFPPSRIALNEAPNDKPLFHFDATENLCGLELLLSKRFLAENPTPVFVDGKEIAKSGITYILDDEYSVFSFDADIGKHTVMLNLTSPVTISDGIYLRGDFDADISISGKDKYRASSTTYLTEHATFTLSKRSKTLFAGKSFTSQGQPHYSGQVDYTATIDVPCGFENAAIVFDNLKSAAKVYVDGEYQGSVIRPPYRLDLNMSCGKHTITIKTANTLGNMLDGVRLPSGLVSVPYLEVRD